MLLNFIFQLSILDVYNKLGFGAVLKSIIGSFKSINYGPSLYVYMRIITLYYWSISDAVMSTYS